MYRKIVSSDFKKMLDDKFILLLLLVYHFGTIGVLGGYLLVSTPDIAMFEGDISYPLFVEFIIFSIVAGANAIGIVVLRSVTQVKSYEFDSSIRDYTIYKAKVYSNHILLSIPVIIVSLVPLVFVRDSELLLALIATRIYFILLLDSIIRFFTTFEDKKHFIEEAISPLLLYAMFMGPTVFLLLSYIEDIYAIYAIALLIYLVLRFILFIVWKRRTSAIS